MTCPHCRSPLLYCNCHDAPAKIEAFLRSPSGRRLAFPLYNRLVQRAARLIDRRIAANMRVVYEKFPGISRRGDRPRKLWRKPVIRPCV